MAQCLTPFTVKNKITNQSQAVPCGKCPACLTRRASGWSFRLMQEAKHAESAHFITLTYAPEHARITDRKYATLDKRDCQLFFKKLRKDSSNRSRKIRYYLVGEYGSQTKRPHYHCILFNATLESIQPAWIHGQIHYGTVEGASIGYCLKYMSKPKTIPAHKNDDRIPEFALMSKGLA